MRYLLVLCFLVAGVFGQAEDIAISLDSLRPAEEIDLELEAIDEENLEENSEEDSEVGLSISTFDRRRPPPPPRRYPRPTPYPRPIPYPRPTPYPRPMPYPQPAPYPRPVPYPRPSATVVCHATDDYGRIYTATAYYASDAQRYAMNECLSHSYYCYERGCNYY
ncbi:MAG: hypothetical protein SGJ18_04710 [Pseudomonadota bacterium]|nr:hypothetical protein [Pseudomonadota bacterium]